MKRSEMVDRIQILLESRGYVGNDDDGEAVLDLVEKLGMLPPVRHINPNKVDYGYLVSFAAEGITKDVLDYAYNEMLERERTRTWESEDENTSKS